MTAEDITRALADAAKAAAPVLPGVGKTVAEWASVALGLAADSATLGKDPLTTITHVRSMLGRLDAQSAQWDEDLLKKFG